jgi:hypothetical protein
MYVTCRCQFKGNGKGNNPRRKHPMNTTIAAVHQSTANTNKQQKQTAKEVIAANVQARIGS